MLLVSGSSCSHLRLRSLCVLLLLRSGIGVRIRSSLLVVQSFVFTGKRSLVVVFSLIDLILLIVGTLFIVLVHFILVLLSLTTLCASLISLL